MVIRFYQAVYQTLTSIRNLFRVKVNELLNGRHSAVRINVGSVAVKKSFGVIGIPCAVNGILHGTFHWNYSSYTCYQESGKCLWSVHQLLS